MKRGIRIIQKTFSQSQLILQYQDSLMGKHMLWHLKRFIPLDQHLGQKILTLQDMQQSFG